MTADWFYKLIIEGHEVDNSIYSDIVSIVIEDNDRFADTFSIRLSTSKLPNGDWQYLDDNKFQLFNNIIVKVGFSNGVSEYLINGYITNVMLRFGAGGQQSYLELRGMDPTCIMNLEEKVVSWANVSDSEIARRIFDSYDFEAKVDPTPIEHREDQKIVMQRGTDIQLLKSLAKRNGFECFVQKDITTEKIIGYFGKPTLESTPQKTISVFFEEKSDITSLDVFVDSLRPLTVQSQQINVSENSSNEVSVDSSSLPKLGQKTLSDLIRSKIERISKPRSAPSRSLMSTIALDPRELQNLCKSLYDEASWFVNIRAEVNSIAYESVLKAKGLVSIRGAGELYSGTCYISKVTHIITNETYLQKVEAKRNAVGLTGNERF